MQKVALTQPSWATSTRPSFIASWPLLQLSLQLSKRLLKKAKNKNKSAVVITRRIPVRNVLREMESHGVTVTTSGHPKGNALIKTNKSAAVITRRIPVRNVLREMESHGVMVTASGDPKGNAPIKPSIATLGASAS